MFFWIFSDIEIQGAAGEMRIMEIFVETSLTDKQIISESTVLVIFHTLIHLEPFKAISPPRGG